MVNGKTCPTCKVEKLSHCFRANKGRPDGMWFECKQCAAVRRRRKKDEIRKTSVTITKKICFTCKVKKPSTAFSGDSMSRDGLYSDCKACYNKKAAVRRAAGGEKLKEAARKRAREWYQKNKEHVKAYQRKYNKENKEKVKKRQDAYVKEKYRTDPNFKLGFVLRRRLRVALRRQYVLKKFKNTFDLLGCSLDDFKTYFRKKFTKGMTWELFLQGKIHIDHIIPCSHFDLDDPTEQKQCFYATNLRPMWGPDNLTKSDKIDYEKDADSLKTVLTPFHVVGETLYA